jgi:hypothetical protein
MPLLPLSWSSRRHQLLLRPACLPAQIGIAPTIPLDAAQLAEIPVSGEAFCRFAETPQAPKLF